MTMATAFATRNARLREAIGNFLQSGPDTAVIGCILAIFVVAWTAFNAISYTPVALHPDLTEIYAWSRHLSPSYYKHPPLGALIAHTWFSVFPVTDWSFHLLAITNAAVGLAITDQIAKRYLDRNKRIFVLLFLMLTPFYQFHGQRFASNQTLLSTWPLATYCFLRAFESRGFGWSLAAGAAAGLAMMGKYYSGFLVMGFPIAAICHPARFRYLKSASPWLSILAGCAVLAPHLYWLWQNGPQTFDYAYAVHGAPSELELLYSVLKYLGGAIGYVAVPCVAYVLATRPSPAAVRQALWPDDPDRRMLVILLLAPLLLPALTAPILKVDLTPLWTMAAWYLLPIVLLAPNTVILTRGALTTVAATVLIVTVIILAYAPVQAWKYHSRGINDSRGYSHTLADTVTREWHARFGSPLTITLGDIPLTTAVSFYSADHPDAVHGFNLVTAPWVTPERMAREGFAVLCPAKEPFCVGLAQQLTAGYPSAQRIDVTLENVFFGDRALPAPFVLYLIPPQAGGATK
jgi:4-amino-4-deoxy-L-arabinose transferase-like glycosyltransferase